jgi:acetyl esterase/lipase
VEPRTIRYGPAPSQFVEVWGEHGPWVVVIHGGYWRARYGRGLMDPICRATAARGYRVANLEYRRIDGDDPADGGRWPAMLDDVLAGIDALDGAPAMIVGHSAGGHLALLAGTLRSVPVAALAPLTDLVAGADLSNGAARTLVAGGDAAAASPITRVPLGVPQLVIVGEADTDVPVDQSLRYVSAAQEAGDDIALHVLSGADHFVFLDPDSPATALWWRWLDDR